MGFFDFFKSKKKFVNRIRYLNYYTIDSDCSDSCLTRYQIKVEDSPIVRGAIQKILAASSSTSFFIFSKNGKKTDEIYIDVLLLREIIYNLIVNGCYTNIIGYSNNKIRKMPRGYQLDIKIYSPYNKEELYDLEERLGYTLVQRIISSEFQFHRYLRYNTQFGFFKYKEGDKYLLGEEIEELNNNYKKGVKGYKNLFDTIIIPYDLDYLRVNFPFEETGIEKIRNINREDIGNVFGIPSVILNDTTHSTYNNVETAYEVFYRDCVSEYLEIICTHLTNCLQNIINIKEKDGYIYFEINKKNTDGTAN